MFHIGGGFIVIGNNDSMDPLECPKIEQGGIYGEKEQPSC